MADEKETNPPPETPTTPKTVDIVGDNNAKEIRRLQDRLSKAEKQNQDMTGELGSLRDIVGKLGTMPPKTPDPALPKKSLLDEVMEFCGLTK